MKENIVLIGMMGTFKTSVAKILAEKLKMDYLVDTDDVIAKNYGAPITKIFAEIGEAGFRKKESELIKSLEDGKKFIISCGGGVVLDYKNIESLKKNGWIVRLTADAKSIYERVKFGKSRPVLAKNLTEKSVQKIIDERENLYASAADFTIDNSANTSEYTAKLIIAEWKKMGGK